ncbi:MAG: hypothetical protein RLZZ385_953 [Pseudomonadota bacterium]|jgi:outer membrane receptor protein involved in Fe transport
MQKKLLVSAIALATALAAQAGSAQVGRQAVEEIQVISTTRRLEGLADVNASVAVIGTEDLRLVSATHYQEAANRLPGVNINRNNGQESLTSIRSPILTGAGACGSFLLAEEGIPLRAAGFCNVNEMFDAHTENAAAIEVVRGPSSAFYGSNAVHGMINVVLPEPSEQLSFTLETGPRGFLRGNVAAGTDSGNFKQLLLLNGVSEEGWRADSGYDQQKASWLYQYTTANGLQLDGGLTVTNLNQETAGYVVGKDSYKDPVLRKGNPNPEAYRDNQSMRLWTRMTAQLANDWEVIFTPYYRQTDLDFIQHFLPGTPVELNEHESLGFQLSGYHNLDENSYVALGFDLESTDGRLQQYQDKPTVGSAFLVGTIPQGKHYDYEVKADQLAPFLHYQRYLGNNWDMTLGLRYERMDYDYDNLMLDGRTRDTGVPCGFGGCRYNRPADRSDSYGDWSPKLGLRYRFDDTHSLSARIQRGFRAPQATELYRLQNAQNVADLESVQIDSLELALEGAGTGWEYSVTGFYMDKENDIVTDINRFNLNDSDTKHRGVELAGALELSDTLTFFGAFNYARHTYTNNLDGGALLIDGKDVDSAPRTFGNFRLQWRPMAGLLSELEWVNMGEYWEDPENLHIYEGHDVVNLRTSWDVSSSVNLSLNILNLFDTEYAERADYTGFGGDRYFTGEPLRAFLALNWNLR